MSDEQAPDTKPYFWASWTVTHWVLAAFLAAALVAVGFGMASGNYLFGGGSSEAQAVKQCEEFAKQRLKAPSTASFDLEATGSGPSYTVTGTVDAENSFGAKMRSNITCKIRLDEDTETAYLESLTGLN